MAVVFQPDPLLPLQNSFISLSDANDFFSKRLFDTVWTTATDPNKEAALMWASSTLGQLDWRGVRTSAAQPLSWPRRGMSYYETSDSVENPLDGSIYPGYVQTYIEVLDTEIPAAVKEAVCELALQLMTGDSTVPPSTLSSGITEIKVDSIGLKFSKTPKYQFLSPTLRNILQNFLKNSSAYSFPVERVG